MEILKSAAAGTLESSDAMVTVEPGEGGIELELSSGVMNQYGRRRPVYQRYENQLILFIL